MNKWACGHWAERVGVGMYILNFEEENEALLVWRNYNAAPRVGGWWRRSGTSRMTPAVFHSSLLLQPACMFQVSNFIIHVLEGLLHDLKLRLGLSSHSNPSRTWMKWLCMNFHHAIHCGSQWLHSVVVNTFTLTPKIPTLLPGAIEVGSWSPASVSERVASERDLPDIRNKEAFES